MLELFHRYSQFLLEVFVFHYRRKQHCLDQLSIHHEFDIVNQFLVVNVIFQYQIFVFVLLVLIQEIIPVQILVLLHKVLYHQQLVHEVNVQEF
jgi:hypothetical protein